jgi:hypothetical protein
MELWTERIVPYAFRGGGLIFMNSILSWVDRNINQSDLGRTRRKTVTWDIQCHLLASLGIDHELLKIAARLFRVSFDTCVHDYSKQRFTRMKMVSWDFFFPCTSWSEHISLKTNSSFAVQIKVNIVGLTTCQWYKGWTTKTVVTCTMSTPQCVDYFQVGPFLIVVAVTFLTQVNMDNS